VAGLPAVSFSFYLAGALFAGWFLVALARGR
jgi:hypothetical protein